MKITVIGTGYVGLVTGACLSEMGNHVVCVDHDAARIAALRQGRIPIHEPGLSDIVVRNASAGRLPPSGPAIAGRRPAGPDPRPPPTVGGRLRPVS